MAPSRRDSAGDGLLATLARGLERGAGRFTPARDRDDDQGSSLPGRRPGAGLAAASQSVERGSGAAVLLDCGTSRREGFTHVLLVSPSAEAILGSHGAEQLGARVGALAMVEDWAWEHGDHLHVRCPEMAHAQVLAAARRAIDPASR